MGRKMAKDGKIKQKPVVAVSWMPDGKGGYQPTPDLLTQREAIRYLRLDAVKTRFPQNTLHRYRKKFGLKTVQIGRQVLYSRQKLSEFVEQQMMRNPR
jgi:hypothetical protein